MTIPFKIVTREEIGLPTKVLSSDGWPRPALFNERWVTFHYTGVSSRGYTSAAVAAEVLRIQAVFEDTKPFEYNYVIGQADDDSIYEFAGLFQAAHSGGENSESFGILFLNAINEPLTAKQIAKAQWLRDLLIYTGALRAQPEQRPHRWMPDAETACPGDLIMGSLEELVKPYVDPKPVVPPYDPARGLWAAWPEAVKPAVAFTGAGAAVLYLNDVMRLKAGQGTCGDNFNAATIRGVRNLERFFGLPIDGVVGAEIWSVVDMLAGV